MADDRWWKELDAVVAATLPNGSRILDIGCGDGGLVDRLTELGFDTIGVDPHPGVLQAITGQLRPAGRLFVSEFAWDTYDQRAAAWLVDHDPSDTDHSIAGWQREHGKLHTWAAIRTALSNCFMPTLEVGRPYLARMLRRRDLEVDEHASIDAQLLPALGIWYVAKRDR